MKKDDLKARLNFVNKDRVLNYCFHDIPTFGSVCVKRSSSMIYCFNREDWRTLERLAQNSLIKAALKKEYNERRLIEIIGIKQNIECADSQGNISLTLEGTAIYS
jgi:hypothetical protein